MPGGGVDTSGKENGRSERKAELKDAQTDDIIARMYQGGGVGVQITYAAACIRYLHCAGEASYLSGDFIPYFFIRY